MIGDFVQTFQLDRPNLRGRILTMNGAIDELLARHDYPHPLAMLTGEAAALAVLLSSMMKYDGIFTLQAQGDGPLAMLVADVQDKGNIRACAHLKEDAAADVETFSRPPVQLLGKGYLAFTVDQGPDTERYQGIVDLKPGSLLESVQHYFTQSEQIDTAIRLALGKDATTGRWRAGAIMLQRLPEQSKPVGEAEEDDWRRVMILLNSCSDDELLAPGLEAEDLLYRLFHEEDARVYGPDALRDSCRCSRERAESVLGMMTPEERQDMVVDGKITVTCEFCNRVYGFAPDA